MLIIILLCVKAIVWAFLFIIVISAVRWKRALRKIGEANPCENISVGGKNCAHAYFMADWLSELDMPSK